MQTRNVKSSARRGLGVLVWSAAEWGEEERKWVSLCGSLEPERGTQNMVTCNHWPPGVYNGDSLKTWKQTLRLNSMQKYLFIHGVSWNWLIVAPKKGVTGRKFLDTFGTCILYTYLGDFWCIHAHTHSSEKFNNGEIPWFCLTQHTAKYVIV